MSWVIVFNDEVPFPSRIFGPFVDERAAALVAEDLRSQWLKAPVGANHMADNTDPLKYMGLWVRPKLGGIELTHLPNWRIRRMLPASAFFASCLGDPS